MSETDELRRPVEIARQPREVAVELELASSHDLHGASAQHVGGPDHDRIADRLGDRARLLGLVAMPLLGWRRLELVEQLLEAVAVLGEVDRVGRGAEDRNFGPLQRLGELERRLAAELHDDAVQRAVRALRRR